MNSLAQLNILDCLWSGCSTKSKDKMMNHRGEGESKKESTRKDQAGMRCASVQADSIPAPCVLEWWGWHSHLPAQTAPLKSHIQSCQTGCNAKGIWTISLLRCLLIRTLWIQGILPLSCSCGWHWGKHSFRGPVQTLPAHLITLTKGGQLWCSLTSNYEAHCGLLTELCRH